MQNISLSGCKLTPLHGYMAVYLVLTIEVYGLILYKGSTIVNLDDKVVLTRTMLIVWRQNF